MKPNTTHAMPTEGPAAAGCDHRSAVHRSIMSMSIFLITAILILTASISAQTTTSTIQGTIKDANGALVAGAQVKASGSTLATERTVVTDTDGSYRIVSLPAGTYVVT
ncbi:MAG: carboxypeptidase-like regulatory domain-containing protein, partial [Pyrinomonadaceae bacterium]